MNTQKQLEIEFQNLCVELFTDLTNRPIGLSYVNRRADDEDQLERRFIISPNSWDRFEPFCQYMHRDPQRKQGCLRNHQRRAEHSGNSDRGMCWAGIHNCTVTRRVGARTFTMMGGEFIPAHARDASIERFEQFADKYGLSEEDRTELLKHLDEVEVWSQEKTDQFEAQLNKILDWYASYERLRQEFVQTVQSVAHEYLIHVTGLNVECGLLKEDIYAASHTSKALKRRVSELHHKIRRLDDVVNNYMTSYQADPRFERCTIGPIVYDAINVYQSQAQEKHVDFQVELQKEQSRTHEIEMAPSYLRRAIHNLVQNAVKYSFSGHRTAVGTRNRYIRISGKAQGDHYLLEIENYGIGIEPDELELIFERGYQGRLTRTEFRPGSGNGLYFVKNVVDMHHGRIHVSSIPTGNAYLTRFTVYLPFNQPTDKE